MQQIFCIAGAGASAAGSSGAIGPAVRQRTASIILRSAASGEMASRHRDEGLGLDVLMKRF